jgi:hypothetical protein
MRVYKTKIFLIASLILVGHLDIPASASTFQLVVAEDKTTGYNRSLFKHWIDADNNGCDTRAEVLLEEATTTPKIGAKCKLTGGKWLSSYDGKVVTNASQLDVDHLVPLAEAWRSGAWMWSDAEREIYANDLQNKRALIAVSASTNRTKGDKDPSKWLPTKDKCKYIESWITVKLKYSLTADDKEASALRSLVTNCGIGTLKVVPAAPTPTISYAGFTEWYGDKSFSEKLLPYLVYIPKIPDVAPSKILVSPYFTRGGQCYDLFDTNDLRNSSKWNNSSPTSGNSASSDFTLLCFAGSSNKTSNKFAYNVLNSYPCSGECIATSVAVNLPELDFVLPSSTPTPEIPIPTPSAKGQIVSPGAFCSPAGAIGKASSGVTYTCKISPTDTRNRWRQ